jgi:hypothetical protein
MWLRLAGVSDPGRPQYLRSKQAVRHDGKLRMSSVRISSFCLIYNEIELPAQCPAHVRGG